MKLEMKFMAFKIFVLPDPFAPLIHKMLEIGFPFEIFSGQVFPNSNEISKPSLKLKNSSHQNL
jgi:hypothetical protein